VDGVLLASAYLSLVLAMRGALSQATTYAEQALALGGAQGWADEIQSTSAWLSLALVHLQRGDVLAARRALDEATLVLERRPDALLEVCRTLATARLLGEHGEAAGPGDRSRGPTAVTRLSRRSSSPTSWARTSPTCRTRGVRRRKTT